MRVFPSSVFSVGTRILVVAAIFLFSVTAIFAQAQVSTADLSVR
jgi:hypothetical protein